MEELAPSQILAELARAIPLDLRCNLVVIGSLAAGYQLFGDQPGAQVRTKDADGVVRPRQRAVEASRTMAERLLAAGWQHRQAGDFGQPGARETPEDRLPAIRLHPPDHRDWFLEFLTLPEPATVGRQFLRVELSTGHFGLPSFTYLPIAVWEPSPTPWGIFGARAEMMALANLLEHPAIRPDTFQGSSLKRSNKDLGRVLAIASLTPLLGQETWLEAWQKALSECFPDDW